jgi:hypothetical protein
MVSLSAAQITFSWPPWCSGGCHSSHHTTSTTTQMHHVLGGLSGASPRPSRVGLGDLAAHRVQAPRDRCRHQVIVVGQRGLSMLLSWAQTLGSCSKGSGVSKAEAMACPRDPQLTLRPEAGGECRGFWGSRLCSAPHCAVCRNSGFYKI